MLNIGIKLDRERQWFAFALMILFIYVSPYYIFGENAHIRVHDNLDSNIAWYKVLARSGELFGGVHAIIPQIINGLPRNAFGSEFSVMVWLYALLPSMTAYALSQTLTRVLAFLGMYFLLKKHFIKEPDACLVRIGVALAFALTPFWPSGMLSTLGHPLALWAFLNIRSKQITWKEWLTLGLLPLYSSFVLGFFFFLFAMGLLWLRDLIVKRELNPYFLGAILYMTTLYLMVEYRLVYSLIFSDDPTSRMEFVSSRLDAWRSVRLSFKNFVLGHGHVRTVHTVVILPLLLIVFYYVLTVREKSKTEKTFLYLFIINFVLSVWYAFWFHAAWQPLKEKFSLFNTFNFSRFHFLRPLIIYVGFALACYIVWRAGGRWKLFVYGCIAAQIAILFTYNEEIYYGKFKAPTFKQFYAESLFSEINHYIGKPQNTYRVASIGLHPAIAQYNGFYTLDTYNNFYPLTYKHEFRGIISKELAKSKNLKTYFDTWGGRCYIFAKELGKRYEFRKHSSRVIRHLELNTEVFKRMGGKYIFSSIPIMNADQNRLMLKKVFTDSGTVWKVYLYEVK